MCHYIQERWSVFTKPLLFLKFEGDGRIASMFVKKLHRCELWINHLMSLGFSFLIYKIKILLTLSSDLTEFFK